MRFRHPQRVVALSTRMGDCGAATNEGKTSPPACAVCRGSGSRIGVPRFCPRHLEIWHLVRVECRACGGTGCADRSAPSDAALVDAWERGGGFHVPPEVRQRRLASA